MKTEITMLLKLGLTAVDNVETDVRAYRSFDDAAATMKTEYCNMEREKGLQPVLDFPESYLKKESAAFFYQSQEGVSSCRWNIFESSVDVPVGIETKLGHLSADVTGAPEHPGITISINLDGKPVDLALVEFCDDEGDIAGEQIITRIWEESLDEDYTHRIIHHLPFVECWANDCGRPDTRVKFVMCKGCGTRMLVSPGCILCPKCQSGLRPADPLVLDMPFREAPKILRNTGMGYILKDIDAENGWSVHIYDINGNRKEIIRKETELECAKACVAQLRMGYPAPTVWFDGQRVEGY